MKKEIKVGLYNPYLDVLGGGEKHILSILKVFTEMNAKITVFWDKNLSKEIENRFLLQSFKIYKWLPSLKTFGTLQKLKELSSFDYFFYVTDGSYFFSTAKKNFIFCMVPDNKLYNLNWLNRLKLWNYKFISNSPYTTKWLSQWNINPITITPYFDKKLYKNSILKKEKVILSVGRFFSHLHSKNQEKIIKTFLNLKNKNPLFKDFKLILAGGLKKEDNNYFKNLKSIAGNDSSIIFRQNVSLSELDNLYELSTYYWHFTGLGIDENKHPEQVEHFGIAPLEAAASGCLVFCHNSGGPKEIFSDGETGYLFNNEVELIEKITNTEINPSIRETIIKQSKSMIENHYNYEVFSKKVKNIL